MSYFLLIKYNKKKKNFFLLRRDEENVVLSGKKRVFYLMSKIFFSKKFFEINLILEFTQCLKYLNKRWKRANKIGGSKMVFKNTPSHP